MDHGLKTLTGISEPFSMEPAPGKVLVKTVFSTVSSGTERANILGEVNVSVFEKSDVAIFPREGGYSSAGIIEKVGPNVTDLQVGDRVALSWSSHSQVLNIEQKNVYKLMENQIINQ